MNILIDLLPEDVEIDGKKYKINSSFRTSILFEMMMQDNELDDRQKLITTLELYYPVVPENVNKAIEMALWFYRCGKDEENTNNQRDSGNNQKNPIYSFEYDDDYIYAAFLAQYGVDLQDISNLHWWKFKAMFKALKDDNEIVKIMGYRSMSIPNDMPKEQKEFYKKMKRLHRIPVTKSEREKLEEIENALLGDGNLSNILK